MPILKKKKLERTRVLTDLDKKVFNLFINWWNDETIAYTLDECQTKFKELINQYKIKVTHIDTIWMFIKEEQFNILKNWYKRHVTGHATNFTYLYSLVYRDTSIPEVQERLLSLITLWKDDIDSRPKPSPLAAIAIDNQSIHTAPVMNQQNITRAILFAVPIPKKQQTIDEVTQAFLDRYGWTENVEKIIDDMVLWGRKSEIVEKGDYLYRKILVHLWAKIKNYKRDDVETYSSLIERLYEESLESLGMCAMGHVNRLCNVLCGFVEGIEAPRDSKEAFQDLIAKLANEEKDIEEKKKDAITLMDTYGIDADQRNAWLEAL
jgi:hypothetical protein